MKKLIGIILLGVMLLVFTGNYAYSGTRIINYGFEDWAGFNANNSPAPGYIYSTSDADTYWYQHRTSTIVIRDPAKAYEGNYYQHRQFNTTQYDPVLGRTATTVNHRGNIGLNSIYPSGSKCTATLRNDIKSDTMTQRFYFRTTNEWKNQTSVTGYLKFVVAHGSPSGTAYIHLSRTDSNDTTLYVYNGAGSPYYYSFKAGTDLMDGRWHCIVVVWKVLSTNNLNARVWVDDWNMSGSPRKNQNCTAEGGTFNSFNYASIGINWSGTYPSTLMGLDLDQIEIWDGIPNADQASGDDPVESDSLNPPTGLMVLQ